MGPLPSPITRSAFSQALPLAGFQRNSLQSCSPTHASGMAKGWMLIHFAGSSGVLGWFWRGFATSVVVRQDQSSWKEVALCLSNHVQSWELRVCILLQPHAAFPCGHVLAEREQTPSSTSEAVLLSLGTERSAHITLQRFFPGNMGFFAKLRHSPAASQLIRCGNELQVSADSRWCAEVAQDLPAHPHRRCFLPCLLPSSIWLKDAAQAPFLCKKLSGEGAGL